MQRAFAHSSLPNRLFIVVNGSEATNYLEGVGIYSDRHKYPFPGLLLLDLKMPKMSGFEVLAWLQGRSQFNNLPRVVLSGSPLARDMQKAKALGADDYRVKSSDVTHLTKLVHELHARWLNGHRKSESSP